MALHDRDYMGRVFAGRTGGLLRPFFPKATTNRLIVVNVVVFFLQYALELLAPMELLAWVVAWLSLSPETLSHGALWTLATHSFLHDGFFHLFANMIGLWCVGRFLEDMESRERILTVYFGGVLAGAFLWLALWAAGDQASPVLVGASAGVFSGLAYSLFRHFNDQPRQLIYFVFPVKVRAKWVLTFLAGSSLLGLLLSEIPESTGWWPALWKDGVGHSAHLGGLLFGAGVFAWSRRHLLRAAPRRKHVLPFRQVVTVRETPPPVAEPPPLSAFATGRTRESPGVAVAPATSTNTIPFPCAPPPPARASFTLETEINRILDKINASGFSALTAAECETLERASVILGTKK